jgi:hypothetical protein
MIIETTKSVATPKAKRPKTVLNTGCKILSP